MKSVTALVMALMLALVLGCGESKPSRNAVPAGAKAEWDDGNIYILADAFNAVYAEKTRTTSYKDMALTCSKGALSRLYLPSEIELGLKDRAQGKESDISKGISKTIEDCISQQPN
jgi:hypothetical protein